MLNPSSPCSVLIVDWFINALIIHDEQSFQSWVQVTNHHRDDTSDVPVPHRSIILSFRSVTIHHDAKWDHGTPSSRRHADTHRNRWRKSPTGTKFRNSKLSILWSPHTLIHGCTALWLSESVSHTCPGLSVIFARQPGWCSRSHPSEHRRDAARGKFIDSHAMMVGYRRPNH